VIQANWVRELRSKKAIPWGRFADCSTGRELGRSRGGVEDRARYWRWRMGARGRKRGRDRK
jgi:hypothetical protein